MAYKELVVLEEEKKEREVALAEAREASRRAIEEAMRLRERAMMVEEAASKAREEARFYKDTAADLDKEKSLVKADLASAREAYREVKEECVKNEIARSATEEAGKKAQEDLEAERTRSRGLSDEVDRLKRALLEKEGAVAQAGKAIEDLRVTNTDLARSYKEVERANTDLVGQNTALEERIRGKLSRIFALPLARCFWCCLISPYWSLQGLRMSFWLPRSRPALPRLSSRGRLL